MKKKEKVLLKHKIGVIPFLPIPIKGLSRSYVEVKNGWVYHLQPIENVERFKEGEVR